MKKLSLYIVAGLATGLFACNNAGSDSVDQADSTNNARIDSQTDNHDNMSADSAQNAADFMVDAANGGMAEIALSKLAQEKSSNAQIKQVAGKIIADHQKANDQLKAIAQQEGVSLPAEPGEDKQDMKNKMAEKTGKDFDDAYIDQMIDDHKKTIKKFEDAADYDNPAVQDFAKQTLPTLREHLDAVQKIKDNSK